MKKQKINIKYPTLIKSSSKLKRKIPTGYELDELFYTLKALENNKSFFVKVKNKVKNKFTSKKKIKEE